MPRILVTNVFDIGRYPSYASQEQAARLRERIEKGGFDWCIFADADATEEVDLPVHDQAESHLFASLLYEAWSPE